MLSPGERKEVLDALRVWANETSGAPVWGYIGGKELLSARELVNAVEDQTEEGEAFLEVIEHGIQREGMSSVLERFLRPTHATSH